MESDLSIQYSKFFVGRRAHAVAATSLRQRNIEFLRTIIPEYFVEVARAHYDSLVAANSAGDLQRRHFFASAVRMSYFQATETFLGLLSAALQAPHAAVAWIQQYRRKDILIVTDAIAKRDSTYVLVDLGTGGWEAVAAAIFGGLLEDSAVRQLYVQAFARFWSRLAADYADDLAYHEYNSIKHGMRVSHGGFSIAVAPSPTGGSPPDGSTLRALGGSQYGSSFQRAVPLEDPAKHTSTFGLRQTNMNWDPHVLMRRIDLLESSFANVRAFMLDKVTSPTEKVTYRYPQDLSSFAEAHEDTVGVHKFDSGESVQYEPEYEPDPASLIHAYKRKIDPRARIRFDE